MREREHTHELPAVSPALQEYDWHEQRPEVEDEALVMSIDTRHLPTPRPAPRLYN